MTDTVAAPAAKKVTVTVIYNGMTATEKVDLHEPVKALLEQALNDFSIHQNRHTMSLYTAEGTELADAQTLRDAGIKNGSQLLLRPSAVKGGATNASDWPMHFGRGTSIPRLPVRRSHDRGRNVAKIPLSINADVFVQTFEMLRECGQGRRECQVLWLSDQNQPSLVSRVMHPSHIQSGDGFELDSTWLTEFLFSLKRTNECVVAQVHTHPGRAFHSATDDAWPIMRTAGFFSLVIPQFALGPSTLLGSFLAQIGSRGEWRELSAIESIEVIQGDRS